MNTFSKGVELCKWGCMLCMLLSGCLIVIILAANNALNRLYFNDFKFQYYIGITDLGVPFGKKKHYFKYYIIWQCNYRIFTVLLLGIKFIS